MEFDKIAPYLKDPLVLVGFVLVLFFGFARAILRSGVIVPVARQHSFRLLRSMLLYGFLLGLAIIALGFGLKYREMSEAEQAAAIRLLRGELDANIATVEQLRQNTISLLSNMSAVATALRTPDIRVVATLFPASNVDGSDRQSPSELAVQAATKLLDAGLDHDAGEMAKAQELARAVRRTIEVTRPTIESLGDREQRRYVIVDAAWDAQLPVLRKVALPGVHDFHASYGELARVRASYGAVVSAVLAYLDAVHGFFDAGDPMGLPKLTSVLTLERQAFAMATTYGDDVATTLERLRGIRERLAAR